jgi:uncharacterized membrane protein
MRKAEWIALLIVIASFAIGLLVFPYMPEEMASHWNARGEVDDYITRFWGVLLMPTVSLAMLLFFLLIPRIDPLKKNFEEFRKYFDGFIIVILSFLLYLYFFTLAWNVGVERDIIQALSPAFAALFAYLGIMLGKTKRNWFIGIRTPWTMSSDKVWEKTHKRGSLLFRAAGLAALCGMIAPEAAIYFILVPPLLSAFYLFGYSYFLYQKER